MNSAIVSILCCLLTVRGGWLPEFWVLCTVVSPPPCPRRFVMVGPPSPASPAPASFASLPPAPPAAIRKKRNFKGLGLNVSRQPPEPPEPSEHPRAGAAKKRPPPMELKPSKASNGSHSTVDLDNNNLLTVNGPNSAPPTGSASAHRMTYHTTLSTTLANLELNSENKYHDLRNEDLKDLKELGQGNGGSVKMVEHLPSGTIMAKKVSVPVPS